VPSLSVAESIGDAAETIVTALALPGATVTQRKRPGAVESDAPPLVTISVAVEEFEPATADDAFAWFGYYRLACVIVRKSNAVQEGADAARDWKQQIRRAITGPALIANGATAVDDCDPEGRTTFDAGAIDKGYDYTPVEFTVRTKEPR
jgi:hypothetical protein